MDKKNGVRRGKRSAPETDNSWDCSVCTYRNSAEAFKCLMCDVRKGTSTRKPRLNQALVAQQAAQQYPGGASTPPAGGALAATAVSGGGGAGAGAGAASKAGRRGPRASGLGGGSGGRGRRPARLRDVDRSSAQTREVTVNSVTVVITEYKPKRRPSRSSPPTSDLDSSDTKP